MNLKQLEAFVQVSESGSFSKAAKELFLTQPTISAHISSLEKELNVRLFIRNTKEVSLSDDGKDLYRYAKQITDLEKAIEERFYMDSDDGKQFYHNCGINNTCAVSSAESIDVLQRTLSKRAD